MHKVAKTDPKLIESIWHMCMVNLDGVGSMIASVIHLRLAMSVEDY